jgi:hypothetical protein
MQDRGDHLAMTGASKASKIVERHFLCEMVSAHFLILA